MSRPFPALSLLFVTVLWGGWLHCSTVADCHRRPIRTKLKVATARDSEGLCRRLYFVIKIDGHALQGHVFKNLSLRVVPEMRRVCTHECLMEPVCVSMNIGPPIQDEFVCELSNSDHLLHPNDLKQREGFMYLGTENPCYSNPCLHNATCLNGFTDKGYLCECQAGYTGEQCENDIDECAMKMDNCSENAMCNNTEGSFNCSCKPGFSGDGINCADIDECTMKIHNCSENAMCNNTEGSFNCSCKPGFSGDGINCTDLDECTMKIHNCSENAMCNNTEGSFNCSCKPGFSGDGINCTDIDECTIKIHNCSENAMCNNTEGSFNCSCKPGFSGDGINCTDIDECTMKIHNCSENAMCNNTEGSFNCSCKPGFSGDGINCTDIDECTMKIHNCSENAMCNNTEGSFNCSCKPGFSGDGINCTDIDECTMEIHNCSENAMCNNTEGSFNCSCKPGFSGDGINCTENWKKISDAPVCFGARDDTYGTFNLKECGLVYTFKLVHKSGSLSCTIDIPSSYWGCDLPIYGDKTLNTVITYPNKTALLLADYLRDDSGCGLKYYFYKIAGIGVNSTELVFNKLPTPLSVSVGEEFHIWYGQDLKNCSEYQ
ncbi:uncharacterized protein LOC144664667 isoform X4 [Oculina patagonica]